MSLGHTMLNFGSSKNLKQIYTTTSFILLSWNLCLNKVILDSMNKLGSTSTCAYLPFGMRSRSCLVKSDTDFRCGTTRSAPWLMRNLFFATSISVSSIACARRNTIIGKHACRCNTWAGSWADCCLLHHRVYTWTRKVYSVCCLSIMIMTNIVHASTTQITNDRLTNAVIVKVPAQNFAGCVWYSSTQTHTERRKGSADTHVYWNPVLHRSITLLASLFFAFPMDR